jgi:hypothetical protein
MAENPNARNRARRKDPFRRAVGAPVKRVTPNLCPLGQCEHAGLLHGERALALERRTRIACGASGCDCKEEL